MSRAAAIRALRGLRTQHEFALELGVRRATVGAWEAGGEVSLRHARLLVGMGLDADLFLACDRPAADTEPAA